MWTLKLRIQLGIRYLVAIVLLFFVWKNSHWAVALTLTLVVVSIELAAINRLGIINELKNHYDQEHKESSNE